MYLRNVILATLVLAMVAFAQNPITADSPFQVKYAANLNLGESWINISNTGANGAPLLGPGFGGAVCLLANTPSSLVVNCTFANDTVGLVNDCLPSLICAHQAIEKVFQGQEISKRLGWVSQKIDFE